jgi:hypothetical protein
MKSVNGGLEFNDAFFGVYLENPAPIRAVVGYFEFATKTIKGKNIRDREWLLGCLCCSGR